MKAPNTLKKKKSKLVPRILTIHSISWKSGNMLLQFTSSQLASRHRANQWPENTVWNWRELFKAERIKGKKAFLK